MWAVLEHTQPPNAAVQLDAPRKVFPLGTSLERGDESAAIAGMELLFAHPLFMVVSSSLNLLLQLLLLLQFLLLLQLLLLLLLLHTFLCPDAKA
jgi:hypothetical protein